MSTFFNQIYERGKFTHTPNQGEQPQKPGNTLRIDCHEQDLASQAQLCQYPAHRLIPFDFVYSFYRK